MGRAALVTLQSHAHALFWSDWKPSFTNKDLPYAHGKVVERKVRTRACLLCAAGPASESAFFSGKHKYYEKDISLDAESLLSQAIPKREWTHMGKAFDGTD